MTTRNNNRTIGSMSSSNCKDEKDFTDVELGEKQPSNQQVRYDAGGRVYHPAGQRTNDIESLEKARAANLNIYSSTGYGETESLDPLNLDKKISKQQCISTIGKLKTRLARVLPYLPLLAKILTTAFAIPGLVFLFSAFHRMLATDGVCGTAKVSNSQWLWIIYLVLWMLIVTIENFNLVLWSKGQGGHVKEAVRVLAGPAVVGLWIGVAAAVGKGKECYCKQE